jgi:hypothetical protein
MRRLSDIINDITEDAEPLSVTEADMLKSYIRYLEAHVISKRDNKSLADLRFVTEGDYGFSRPEKE